MKYVKIEDGAKLAGTTTAVIRRMVSEKLSHLISPAYYTKKEGSE